MIITQLLKHQWKEMLRSSFWQKSVWVNILLALLAMYMIIVFASIGYFADEIVKSIYKERSIAESFTGILFYYFIIDLLMRFLMQKVPVLSIMPYLTLPVRKRTLINYPLIKTIPGFFNLAALLLILPFFFKVIIQVKPSIAAITWIVTILSLIFFNNFLAFWLKKYMAKKPVVIILLLVAIAFTFYLDISGIFPLSNGFTNGFKIIEKSPVLLILPLLMACFSYIIAWFMLKRNSYIEEDHNKSSKVSSNFLFLSKYGETGILIQNELRLIFRNKRPKTMMWLSLIFMLYGFIFYVDENINKEFILVFAGLFITSSASMTYGQMIFSWESSFFDFITTSRISPVTYLKSKFLLFACLNTINYILTLPYGFLSSKILIINTALFIYNTGISSFILLFFGTFNFSRIDLGKSQFMNWQGTNATQFLLMIPLFGIPMLFVFLSGLFAPQYTGYIVLAIMGLLGIIFNDFIIRSLVKLFLRNRYKMAAGYRKK